MLIETILKALDLSQLWLSIRTFWLRENLMILVSKPNWRQMKKLKNKLRKRLRKKQRRR